jgi:hypothetical protein
MSSNHFQNVPISMEPIVETSAMCCRKLYKSKFSSRLCVLVVITDDYSASSSCVADLLQCAQQQKIIIIVTVILCELLCE